MTKENKGKFSPFFTRCILVFVNTTRLKMRESKYWNEAGNICPSVPGNATSQTEFIQKWLRGGLFLSLTDRSVRRKTKGMGKKPNVVVFFPKGYCWHRGTCVCRSHSTCCFITQTTCRNIRRVDFSSNKGNRTFVGDYFLFKRFSDITVCVPPKEKYAESNTECKL